MMIRHAMTFLLTLLVAVSVGPVFAAPRDASIELLRAIATGREDGSIRIRVNEGAGRALRIGDELVYRFEADRAGYLTAIHLDTHGAATLLYPRANAEQGRLDSDTPVVLPSSEDGFNLAVQPPIGRDVLYAIVTDSPLSRDALGIESRDIVVSFEPHQVPALVRQLRAALDARPSSEIRIAHIEQDVEGRGDVQYRSADIVGFFGERTRSIRPAKLDLQIQFAVDSASLDQAAQRNVDEFARALENPRLEEMRFKVSGHTDDQGSEIHNMDLSRRRAETVRRYLIDRGGIEEERLTIEALGESTPLMSEESDYARRMNRRVEFTPIR